MFLLNFLSCCGATPHSAANLEHSTANLELLYATGAAACSTSDLLLILTNINNSLDNINKHLNKAYFETWRYIQVRIGY